MSNYNDHFGNLMRLAQKGDNNAYAQLFHEIAPMIRAFVGKKLSRPEDAEDVVQEALLSIHKGGHTYDTNRPFTAWMYTIARYRLNDYLRQSYKNKELQSVSFDDVAYNLSSEDNVTKAYENHEYVHEALKSLPEKQEKIVTMMKLKGYSVKETARAMNMSESAVKTSAHRAYKTLEEKLKKEE